VGSVQLHHQWFSARGDDSAAMDEVGGLVSGFFIMTQRVRNLLQYVYNDAKNSIKAQVSSPLGTLSVVQISQAEATLLAIRKALARSPISQGDIHHCLVVMIVQPSWRLFPATFTQPSHHHRQQRSSRRWTWSVKRRNCAKE
jgi:hypothetical protein